MGKGDVEAFGKNMEVPQNFPSTLMILSGPMVIIKSFVYGFSHEEPVGTLHLAPTIMVVRLCRLIMLMLC